MTQSGEKLYDVFMDGDILDRRVTKEMADKLVDEYIELDDVDGEEHSYSIKPAK